MRNLATLRSEFEKAAQRLHNAVTYDSRTDEIARLAGEYALAASQYSKALKQVLNTEFE